MSLRSLIRARLKSVRDATNRLRSPAAGRDLQKSELLRVTPRSRRFGLDRGQPIDRRYIDQFLAAEAGILRGVVIEVADDRYARRFSAPGSDIRILHRDPQVDAACATAHIIGDLAVPETMPEAVADAFICTQTLQFVFDLTAGVRGTHRLLRPGGVLLATLPCLSQISRYDADRWGDFWRLTPACAEKLFSSVFGTGAVTVRAYGNALAARAFIDGLAIEDLPDPTVLDQADPDYPLIIGIRAQKSLTIE